MSGFPIFSAYRLPPTAYSLSGRLHRQQQPERAALVQLRLDRDVAAVQAGARGYLLKGAPRDELFSAIRVVAGGGSLLQPAVAARLIQRMAAPASPELIPLTDREREVLGLLAQGMQNKEIAGQLHISERTVHRHVSNIFTKLDVDSRTAAVAHAIQNRIVELGPHEPDHS